jgi:hypothetical protein
LCEAEELVSWSAEILRKQARGDNMVQPLPILTNVFVIRSSTVVFPLPRRLGTTPGRSLEVIWKAEILRTTVKGSSGIHP